MGYFIITYYFRHDAHARYYKYFKPNFQLVYEH